MALLFVLLSGCGSTARLFQEYGRSQPEFKVDIPFEDRGGMVIIPVQTGGKTGSFLLDTGAPNIISPALASELGAKSQKQIRVRDTHGKTQKLPLVQLDSIDIGGVRFYHTVAIVADLNAQVELACLGIDGLIGANLLSGACLQVDYANRYISIASHLDSLGVDSTELAWPFTTTAQGTPKVDIRAHGVPFSSLTVDTGSSGWIDLPGAGLARVKAAGPVQVRSTLGISTIGLFGGNDADTLFRTWVGDIRTADSLALPPSPIDFQGKGHSLIGNAFWQHFTLTIDWAGKKLFLKRRPDFAPPALDGFGFRLLYRDGQLQVGIVWDDGQAAAAGMKTGDRVLFMNGMDCINFSQEQYCRFFLDMPMKEKWETLDLLIEQEGATRRVVLEKKPFFEE